MDPAPRPGPVSSVAFAYLGNAYNSTSRLNDGKFTVHRFSVTTSARLHKSECVFRFYVYGGIFDNPPGLLPERGTDCFWFLISIFFLLFECKQWGPHPPKEHSSPSGAEDFLCLGFYYWFCLLFMLL
jgi:hypothetical protein